MMRSIAFPSSSPSLFPSSSSSSRSSSKICSTSGRSNVYIPKLEPFSRSKIDRGVKEPSFIEKSENELLDYCTTLDGDESFSCWRAYFELKELERELPKEEVEKLIHQTEGVKSLIDCVHGVSDIHKRKNAKTGSGKAVVGEEKRVEKACPIPDGLPKSEEDIEEEEKGRMPDSPFTRLLRSKGRSPAWFSAAPDHETD